MEKKIDAILYVVQVIAGKVLSNAEYNAMEDVLDGMFQEQSKKVGRPRKTQE